MKKAPLFVEQLMAREIAKKPDYYNAAAIAKEPTGTEMAAQINREKDEQLTAYLRR